jgi:hypothetical protein
MRYIYTYQTKNLINGKTYVGVHSTNRLNDGYIGNGVTRHSYPKSQIRANKANPFVLAVDKYGYSNFKKEILCFFDTKEEAYEEESFLVDYKWVRSKDNYNVALGGMYNSKPIKLYDYKELINEMYCDASISYRSISEKFNMTKGGWISLITDESRIKRKNSTKTSFYNGLEVVNLYGQVEVLVNEDLFLKKTGLSKKTIHKLNKSGYSCGWYIKGSDKYINKINEIEDRGIIVNGKYYELKEVYSEGVKVFSKKHNIYIATLEKKINNAKNIARGGK